MEVSRRRFLELAAVGSGAMAGCSGDGGDGDDGGTDPVVETSEVGMVSSQFDPRNIHVDEGATVTWTNQDGHQHTVTAASDNWENDATVAAGGETTQTFAESGVYDVYCTFHGSADLTGMSMKIGVGDATIQNPLGGATGGGGYG